MRYLTSLLVLLPLFSAPSHAKKETGKVTVAVAASFAPALEEIAKKFTDATGYEVVISPGASGKITAQIENNAPFDIFLSADQKYSQSLVKKKFAQPQYQYTYAIGSLVLWGSKANNLKKLTYKRLAIANPEFAPYGRAAKEALTKMGLWDQVQDKLVMGENVAHVQQFVVSGNAQLGFLPYAQVKNLKRGSYWMVSKNLYSPIVQDLVLLKKSETNPAARKFFDYLKGKEARQIILNYGYQ